MTTLRLLPGRASARANTTTDARAEERATSRPVHQRLAPLSALLDVELFDDLDVAGAQALLRDLSFAVLELARDQRARLVVPTEARSSGGGLKGRKGAVWEIGMERDGDELVCSVFRQGAEPVVAQADRALSISAARHALLAAVARSDEARAHDGDAALLDRGLALAREQLEALSAESIPPSRPRRRQPLEVVSHSRHGLIIQCSAELRRPREQAHSEVARADLHSLLFRGDVSFSVGKSVRRLEGVHVFLFAEQLVALTAQLLDARASERAMQRRVRIGPALIGMQLDHGGEVKLMLGSGNDRIGWRLPPLAWQDLAGAVVSMGRRLAKALVAIDRSQSANLRMKAFRSQVSDLRERVRGESVGPSLVNETPESYRAFAESDSVRPPEVAPHTAAAGKLRFDESWRADVPGIDLRSVFLAGELLLVAAGREVACIERSSGQLVWTRRSHRAVSLLTPVGLVRLGADGLMVLHDLSDGEPVMDLKLGPCVGASTSGTVVAAPGLPNMLLVAEGARHLAAVDLDSGEVRWRRAIRRSGALRMRRAGKLLVVAAGEPQLLALDLLSGEVLWRRSSRCRYAHGVTLDRGDLFAVSSELPTRPSTTAVEHIDPFSGKVRWRQRLPRPIVAYGTPIASASTVVVLTREPSSDRLGAIGLDRASGRVRFDMPGGLCEGRAGWLVVDDLLIVNSERGELVGVDIAQGKTRYRHVFAGGASRTHPADCPQSVQPVLRSGALFLPQSEVYVVRPDDGAMLGRLPCDLVPDALRVDERCGVYVAEASGYLGAYHALPMLTLVKAIQ